MSQKKGKLIVLEGIDGSGKSTQYKLLCERFALEGIEYRSVDFPRYSEESSALVRMYLGGEFGDKAHDVNANAASIFYAVDRYASYMLDWREYYESGGLVLSDRYTTSNAVHQGAKLGKEERDIFFDWLYDLEYVKLGIPVPDRVIYLAVDVETSMRRTGERESVDIHEKDAVYLSSCVETGLDASSHYGWELVEHMRDGELRTEREIHEQVYEAIKAELI